MAANLGHKAKPLLGELVRMMKRKGLETGLQHSRHLVKGGALICVFFVAENHTKQQKKRGYHKIQHIWPDFDHDLGQCRITHLLNIVGA